MQEICTLCRLACDEAPFLEVADHGAYQSMTSSDAAMYACLRGGRRCAALARSQVSTSTAMLGDSRLFF